MAGNSNNPKGNANTAGKAPRRYSDAQRLAALAYYKQDGRIKQTAQAFDIPYKTMQNWIVEYQEQEPETLEDTEERMAIYKKELTAEIRNVMKMALQQVVKKMDGANAYQATTIFGILFDKVNILEGNLIQGAGGNLTINNNTIINQLPDQEIERLKARLMAREHQRQAGAVEADFEVIQEKSNIDQEKSDIDDSSSDPEK